MLSGIYLGVVEKVNDPDRLGRIKVRVPSVYGIEGDIVGAISVDNLPWAIPMGMPAGNTQGFSMLPEVGDQVAVQFLDGEPEKPLWQWLMQSNSQAKNLKLHDYGTNLVGGNPVTGDPDRVILTRYGHSLEIGPSSVTLTTNQGQQVRVTTSKDKHGGTVELNTPKGQSLQLNDVTDGIVAQANDAVVLSGPNVQFNAASAVTLKSGRFTFFAGASLIRCEGNSIFINTGTGAKLVIDANGNIAITSAGGANLSIENSLVMLGEPFGTGMVIESGKISINAAQIVINTSSVAVGLSATWPVAMMTTELIAYLLGHTHPNGEGGQTGPPTWNPTVGQDASSTTMKTS